MKKGVLLLLFLIFYLFAFTQEDSTDIFDLTLFDLTQIKVATPTKNYQNIQSSPSTIIIITQKEIFENNYTCLRDLLADIPQILIQRKSSAEDEDIFTINGIQGIEKFLLLMDGVRINSASGTNFPIGEAYSLENVKQVEIILNPSSVLYGADAYTAIINIITFKPKENKKIYINAGTGSYATELGNLLINREIGKIGISISGKYYYSEEPFMPRYYPDKYQWFYHYQETGEVIRFGDTITPPIGIRPWDIHTRASSLKTKLTYKNTELGFASFYNGHSTAYISPPESAIYSKEAHYHTLLSTVYLKNSFSNKKKTLYINTLLSTQNFKILPNSAFVNQYTGFYIGYKYENNNNLHWEENFIFQPQHKNFHFHFGYSFDYFDVIPKTGDLPIPYDENKQYDEQFIPYPGTDITDSAGNSLIVYQDIYRIKYNNTGVYFQFEKYFAKKFHLTLGYRGEYNSRYGGTFIPRASIIFTPIKRISLKLMYGKSFLAPSPHIAYQHFGAFVPRYDSLGNIIGLEAPFWRLINPNLKPELKDTYAFEFYISDKDNKTFLTGHFFYNSLYNLITKQNVYDTTFHGIPVDYAWIPVNKDKGYTYGCSFIIGRKKEISPFNLSLIISYTYINGKISNQPLTFYTPHSVKGTFNISLPGKFNLVLGGQYRDKTYLNTETYSPSYLYLYSTGNFLIYQNKNFDLWQYLKIYNLLNRRYYNVTDGDFGLQPQDPIRLIFGIKLNIK